MATLPTNLAEKLAALKAKKEQEKLNETDNQSAVTTISSSPSTSSESNPNSNGLVGSSTGSINSNLVPVGDQSSGKVSSIEFGSTQTVDINHLDFLSKLNELQEQIHNQHPQMPLLLRTIHKNLMEDPELVTLLNEEAIAVVVKGLEIHTKTELISQATKESKSKSKKIVVTEDMF